MNAPEAAPAAAAHPPAPPAEPIGRRFLVWNLGALAVAAAGLFAAPLVPGTAPASSPTTASGGATSRLAAPVWDDGKAEVARYDAERVIYGKPRSYELTTVFVKELFDPATRTKPQEPRPGTVDALKLVRVEDVPSGRLYRYRQTLTLRIARHDPERLLDAACGSQEWCGNSFALIVAKAGQLHSHSHSYLDGEGDREDRLPAGTWLEDQLAATLRGLDLAAGFARELTLLPTIVSNHHPGTKPVKTRIAVEGDETLATPAGSFACVRVRATREDQQSLALWFAREAPHVLVKSEATDGRKQLLRSVERTVYWRD